MGSAPELLPSPSKETKYWYNDAASGARTVLRGAKDMLERMQKGPQHPDDQKDSGTKGFWKGVDLGKRLLDETHCSDPWKVLALLWVQTLVYAAPYGEVQAHMQHLAQGGEFITHIWAVLYHSSIFEWKQPTKEKSSEDRVQRERKEEESEYGGQAKKEERNSEDKSKRRIIRVKRKPRPRPES
jgi:hypothetical protein